MEPRFKTYSAANGIVYRYAFAGQVAAGYLFDVDCGTRSAARVTVRVSEAALARELNASERYSVAKMALWRAFDERPPGDLASSPVEPGAAEITHILEELDL